VVPLGAHSGIWNRAAAVQRFLWAPNEVDDAATEGATAHAAMTARGASGHVHACSLSENRASNLHASPPLTAASSWEGSSLMLGHSLASSPVRPLLALLLARHC
jgi:hypothetical protein